MRIFSLLHLSSECLASLCFEQYRSIEAAIKANLSVPTTLFIREPDSERENVPVKWREFPAILKWDNAPCDGRYVKGRTRWCGL